MKLLLSIVFVFLTPVLYAQQSMSKTTNIYNDEGKLQMQISYSPSCSCRIYTEFYPDGKVYARRTFKVIAKGEYVDGEDITYYHDGSIKHYKLWKNTLPDGRAYSNYENGKLEHEEFYNGKYKSGIWKYYNTKGELIKEQVYNDIAKTPWNSKKDNATIRYYASNKLLYTDMYTDGKKVKSSKKDTVKVVVPATQVTDGKQLYTLRCAACHAPDKDGYGPALRGVTKRRSKEWIERMIRNGMELVNSGDKEALALYEKWGRKKHLNMEVLNAKQVAAIIDYLRGMK